MRRRAKYITPVSIIDAFGYQNVDVFVVDLIVGTASQGSDSVVNYLVPALIRVVNDRKREGYTVSKVEIVANTPGAYDVRIFDPRRGKTAGKKTLYSSIAYLRDLSMKSIVEYLTESERGKERLAGGVPLEGEYIYASNRTFENSVFKLTVEYSNGYVFVRGYSWLKFLSRDGTINTLKMKPKTVAFGRPLEVSIALANTVLKDEEYTLNIPRPYVYAITVKEGSRVKVFSFLPLKKPENVFAVSLIALSGSVDFRPSPEIIEPCSEAVRELRILSMMLGRDSSVGVHVTDAGSVSIPSCGKLRPGKANLIPKLNVAHFPVATFFERITKKPLVEEFYSVYVSTGNSGIVKTGKEVWLS